MAVELGMVNVTVRREALRSRGLEAKGLGGLVTQDEHLVNFAFMSGVDAEACAARLRDLGLEEGRDLADRTSDWVEFGHWAEGYPIFHVRYARLPGTDPCAIVESEWLKARRDKVPGPRPWAAGSRSGRQDPGPAD